MEMPLLDVSHLPESRTGRKAKELAGQEDYRSSTRSDSCAVVPSILVKLGDETISSYLRCITSSATDGPLAFFMRELVICYNALTIRRSPELPVAEGAVRRLLPLAT